MEKIEERVYGIEMSEPVETLYVNIQPGDGTTYHFLLSRSVYHPDEYVTVTNVEGLASGYELRKDSIIEAYPRLTRNTKDRHSMENIGDVTKDENNHLHITEDHYVGYVAGHMGVSGKPINPWTARAAILAAYHALQVWGEA